MSSRRKPRYPKLSALAAPWTNLEWWATCAECGHRSRVPEACLHQAIVRLGGGVAACDARPNLICSACGGHRIRTRVERGEGAQGVLPLGGSAAAVPAHVRHEKKEVPRQPAARPAWTVRKVRMLNGPSADGPRRLSA